MSCSIGSHNVINNNSITLVSVVGPNLCEKCKIKFVYVTEMKAMACFRIFIVDDGDDDGC